MAPGAVAGGAPVRGTIVYKMTGSGNDFVLLDGRSTTAGRLAGRPRVAQLCDRRNGVGADGLVVLTPEQPGAVRMTYWNSDGSRAAMCGNAALCSTRLAVFLELAAAGRPVPPHRRRRRPGALRGRRRPGGDPPAGLRAGRDAMGRRVRDRAGSGRALAGLRHRGRAAPDHPGRRHRGGRRGRPRPARCGTTGGWVPRARTSTSSARRPAPGEPWLIRTYERGVEGETLACGTGTVAAGAALAARGRRRSADAVPEQGGPAASGAGRGRCRVGVGCLAGRPRQAGLPGGLGGLSPAVASGQTSNSL